jgi:hypothetical protein
MIPWREKWRAFAIHFTVTLLLAAGAAAVIFLVWFPRPFDELVGGAELFMLVVGCDLGLGPLLSLVVYDSRKGRRELLFDYSIIGLVQLTALAYGVWIVAGTRPVYIVFVGDRFEIVSARDIAPAELAAARDPAYRSLPVTGPRLVATVVPAADHNDVLFKSLEGNDVEQRPKFYVPYESQLATVLEKSHPLTELDRRFPKARDAIARARAKTGLPDARLRWLPVRCREAFWTVMIDSQSGKPLAYFDLDPL